MSIMSDGDSDLCLKDFFKRLELQGNRKAVKGKFNQPASQKQTKSTKKFLLLLLNFIPTAIKDALFINYIGY